MAANNAPNLRRSLLVLLAEAFDAKSDHFTLFGYCGGLMPRATRGQAPVVR